MAVQAARVTVATSATRLDADETDSPPGKSVTFTNRDASVSVDIGPSTVTSGAGYELKPGTSISMDLNSGESVYGIVASGTVRVDVLRQSE